MLRNCFLTIPRKLNKEEFMNKTSRKKALSLMEVYDEKLKKAEEELNNLAKKRDRYLSMTINEFVNEKKISLAEFFEYMELMIEDKKSKN